MQRTNPRDVVEQALNTILQDAKFAAAPQMSSFLRYVVTQTLDGNGNRIKAYTVAIDALGKPATFDPQNDPSVRVLAKRLRDTLTAYYERTSGHEVYIKLYCGSYVPEFQPAAAINDHEAMVTVSQKNGPSMDTDLVESAAENVEPRFGNSKNI